MKLLAIFNALLISISTFVNPTGYDKAAGTEDLVPDSEEVPHEYDECDCGCTNNNGECSTKTTIILHEDYNGDLSTNRRYLLNGRTWGNYERKEMQEWYINLNGYNINGNLIISDYIGEEGVTISENIKSVHVFNCEGKHSTINGSIVIKDIWNCDVHIEDVTVNAGDNRALYYSSTTESKWWGYPVASSVKINDCEFKNNGCELIDFDTTNNNAKTEFEEYKQGLDCPILLENVTLEKNGTGNVSHPFSPYYIISGGDYINYEESTTGFHQCIGFGGDINFVNNSGIDLTNEAKILLPDPGAQYNHLKITSPVTFKENGKTIDGTVGIEFGTTKNIKVGTLICEDWGTYMGVAGDTNATNSKFYETFTVLNDDCVMSVDENGDILVGVFGANSKKKKITYFNSHSSDANSVSYYYDYQCTIENGSILIFEKGSKLDYWVDINGNKYSPGDNTEANYLILYPVLKNYEVVGIPKIPDEVIVYDAKYHSIDFPESYYYLVCSDNSFINVGDYTVYLKLADEDKCWEDYTTTQKEYHLSIIPCQVEIPDITKLEKEENDHIYLDEYNTDIYQLYYLKDGNKETTITEAGTYTIYMELIDESQSEFKNGNSFTLKVIDKTNEVDNDDVNIFKCFYHWLILLFIVLYLAVEAGIFMIAPKNELEVKDNDNDFVKWIKKLSIENICHLTASLIWFIFFIIGCINAKCAICVIFLIIEFLLILCVLAYVFLPYTKVVIDKISNWNKNRKRKDSKVNKIIDKVIDKTVEGLEKASEVASEAKEQVSLADATKVALANLPAFVINKKTIADYLEDKYNAEGIIINRKANVVANTKLPLADTHYVKVIEDGKENKACFVYVYELETMFMDKQCTGMLLLVKGNKDLLKNYQKKHELVKASAFPIGGQWMAMPIDGSYTWDDVTKILDEIYDYQLGLLKDKLAEKKAKATEKAKDK